MKHLTADAQHPVRYMSLEIKKRKVIEIYLILVNIWMVNKVIIFPEEEQKIWSENCQEIEMTLIKR